MFSTESVEEMNRAVTNIETVKEEFNDILSEAKTVHVLRGSSVMEISKAKFFFGGKKSKRQYAINSFDMLDRPFVPESERGLLYLHYSDPSIEERQAVQVQ